MDPSAPQTIVVVSHTHWDREWYHPLGRMRQRLVRLIDALLDAPDGLPFLLDGQAIVLDDYRAVKPEREPALRAALAAGQLEAGPWYVLSDLLIPGGEALVRNLLEGARSVREAGGVVPDVLYSPDAFGHSAAGPALAEGFGLRVAVVWRGFGGAAHPASTVVRWTHASGASVLLYHLPHDGYEIGSSLPVAPDAAQVRWTAMRDAMLAANPTRVSLLPNGADHHARQSLKVDAVAALAAAAEPHLVVCDTLRGFASRLVAASATITLPTVSGELRDSAGWTWSLQGTFATRAHQKRVNAQVERLLVRDAEPWAALAWFTRRHDEPSLRLAWKTLLATHPHDTLCGCSVDDVAMAADQRWADARTQAVGTRDDALRSLIGCDEAAQRARELEWQPTLILRNPAARARGGAVRLRLIDQIVAEPVGPGSAGLGDEREIAEEHSVGWSGDERLQLLSQWREFDRVESPLHYPRNARVRVSDVMAWIAPVSGYAINTTRLSELNDVAATVPDTARVRASADAMASSAWNLTTERDGIVATHAPTGLRLSPAGFLESITDAGDTYTPSLRGMPMTAHWSAPKVMQRGPLRAEWQLAAAIERPRNSVCSASEPYAAPPTHDLVTVFASATLALIAGTDWIELSIKGDNPAGDHRLRWILQLPHSIRANTVVADAAFGTVTREVLDASVHAWPAEHRLPTAPLHRWLYLEGDACGFGIVSDGLAEYELLPDGHLAITLLRAVGELSRRDIIERPGHAGWPASTPLAQSRGPFEARFALMVLPADRDDALTILENAADDFLMPVAGETWRGVATPLTNFDGLSLTGDGLVFSAAKRSEEGEWVVLRCVNQRAVASNGVWHLPRAANEVRHSRLDESPGEMLSANGTEIPFVAAPHSIITILVR
jgi:mannosylglycerate hydrolase